MTQHLLVAADRFDLTRLRAICEARLCDMVEVETAATTLALAEQNNATALKSACLEYVASHLSEVMLTEGYKHMEQSARSCERASEDVAAAQQNAAARGGRQYLAAGGRRRRGGGRRGVGWSGASGGGTRSRRR